MTQMIDFDAAYRVEGYSGIAWRALRFKSERVWTADFEDFEEVVDESMLIMRMVGDDRDFEIDVADIAPLDEDDYCHGCGQIGCGWC